MPAIKNARPQPLLSPPPEKSGREPWMAATPADRRLIENAVGWAEGDGAALAELLYYARGVGIDPPLTKPLKDRIASALSSARLTHDRRRLAKLIFLTGRMKLEQGGTGKDAEILGRPYPPGSSHIIFDSLGDLYRRRQIGAEPGRDDAKSLAGSCLGTARQFRSGELAAEMHFYSRELGCPADITSGDKLLMKRRLEEARVKPIAADVAKMLFLLDRLFPKEAPKEPPPVPPLKKFAR